MTAHRFRQMALALDGAIESAHMNHPDFRVNGRIFATLGYPDDGWGMVALPPEQQQSLMREHDALTPASGAWGVKGATMVRLAEIEARDLQPAMTLAWQNAMAKKPARRSPRKS